MNELYALDPAGDIVPDDCDCSHGIPGDGSGEDDLADLMAHGDEGCCDGPDCDDVPYDEPEDAGLDALYEDRYDVDFYGGE